MKFPLLLFLAVFLLPIKAPSLTVEGVFDSLRETLKTGTDLDATIADLDDLKTSELTGILERFDPVWKKQQSKYLKDYQEFVYGELTGRGKNEADKHIDLHREAFMGVYQLGEGAMKPLLKTKSMPAMKDLRRLILPTAEEIFATAPSDLKQQRKIVLSFAEFRDAVVETAVLNDERKVKPALLDKERELIASKSGLPRDGLRIIEKNTKIAEKEELPADEREGIRELNEWRLLVGLNALVLDPKLCEAGRGHSKDMSEHNFFAHISPLPGKTKPEDRAAKVGTTGGGENIHRGQENPGSANAGWFYSPGHHKNLFRPSYQRVGLGHFKGFWTQMFD